MGVLFAKQGLRQRTAGQLDSSLPCKDLWIFRQRCLPVFAPFDECEFFYLGLQEIRTPSLKVVAVLVGPCLSNRTV